jgi:hypothetical protein
MACNGVLLALVGFNKNYRTQIDQQIRRLEDTGWGLQTLRKAVIIWLQTFVWLFGRKLFSWRFLVFTPVYTLVISVLLIAVWVFVSYAEFYTTHSFNSPVYMSVWMKEEIHEWFSFGILIAIALDYPAVFLTKLSLRSLSKRTPGPLAFAAISVLLTFCIYFVFSLAIHALRVYDMITLYEWLAPNDPLRPARYELFPLPIEEWVTLHPATIIHVTSQGWISTYFFPEPILFYCMVATASMLPFLTVAYASESLLSRAVHAAGSMYRSASGPAFQAKNVIVVMLLCIFTLCTISMWVLTAMTGRCLPAG